MIAAGMYGEIYSEATTQISFVNWMIMVCSASALVTPFCVFLRNEHLTPWVLTFSALSPILQLQGLPMVCLILPCLWLLLSYNFIDDRIRLDKTTLREEFKALGSMTRDEKVIAATVVFQVIGWVARSLVLSDYVGSCSVATASSKGDCKTAKGEWDSLFAAFDAGIACIAAIFMFLVPSAVRPGERILDWNYTTKNLPFGIVSSHRRMCVPLMCVECE
jgi:hypothetical protein